ncbi:type II secretion system F family protein [Nocardioides sp. Bht2]|uniref:type II secretion system F family protein n=1 Tax=Nocardioides sp. Bht2 TaxID=3392297 RepID=UPI0039B42B6E
MIVLATALVVVAVLLAAPARGPLLMSVRGGPDPGRRASGVAPSSSGRRLVLAVLAGSGTVVMLGGVFGTAVGAAVATMVWTLAGRMETPEERRLREQRERQLPDVVALLGMALRSGAPVASAMAQVREVRPGPVADALAQVAQALARGVGPRQAWSVVLADPALARLARGLLRAAESGAPAADAVARISAELAAERRMAVADRARTVGVKAALPLGICLLPAFLLLGIVPLVAASLATLPW